MTTIRSFSQGPFRLTASAAVVLLSACGGSHTNTSQVAVKVNSDEISVHQLNERLARVSSTGLTDAQKVAAQKNSLELLVDQELLIEQAKAKQLDRDPQVVSAMEAARAQILADAYVQKQIMPNARPSDADIQKYYDDNPDLFANRRVYALQEATVQSLTDDQRQELKKRLAASTKLEDAITWLKAQNVKVGINMGVLPAEQIPMVMLSHLARTRDGAIDFFEVPNGTVNIVKVVSSQPAPIDLKTARPTIEQFLSNRKRDELVRAEVKRLRDGAKIQYVGEFQKLAMQTDAGKGQAAAASDASAAPVGTAAAAESGNKSSDAIAKGLKGL